MESKEATGTNTKILLSGGSKGFKKWNGDVWEQVPLAESSKEFVMDEEDEVDEGLPMKVLEFMGLPKSYRKTLYREFVHDMAQIPTETASSFNNIVNWICGEGESEIQIVPNTASSAGDGDIGGRVERLQIVSTSSNESVGSQKNIRILRTDSASNMNIVTPFGIFISDDQKQREEPQHFQLVEAMEVQIPNNIIKIAPSLHGLKFEEVSHDQTDIKITEALFHKTLHVEEPPNEKGDIKIINSNILFRQPSKIEVNSNEKGDTKPSKTLLFRKPSKHVCMSETSIYCYQKSDTEEEVESCQVGMEKRSSAEEKARGTGDKNNQNPSNQSQSRHVCTSETSIYCYGVSESETDGEFSKLNDEDERTSEVEEVKRVTFASPSETNIYAYQDYEEEEENEEEQREVDGCQQVEVTEKKESQEAKEDPSNDSMTKELKEGHHLEGQMSGKESGTEEEETAQEEEPNKSEKRPRKSYKIRDRRMQNEVLEQIKQILQENNKINEKKVQTRDVETQESQDNQVEKVLSDALVQTKDDVPDCHQFQEQNTSRALSPRPNPVSIMKNSRGNSSKTSIQFSLPHQVASFSSHDMFNQDREIFSEPCRINAQTNFHVGMAETNDMPIAGFREIFNEGLVHANKASHHIEERGLYNENSHREQIPNIQAQQIKNQASQHMNEIHGENILYNFKPLEQSQEIKGFKPPQEVVQERMKEEVSVSSISCPTKTSASTLDKEKSPPNTTSEVQIQLNNDLKKLENIVKKLYKSLNKKGPLTLVANFKPKQDGELALDMSSLTGNKKKEVSFSTGLSGDGNSNDKLHEKSSKMKVDENKHEYNEEFTKEPRRQEIGRNLSHRSSTTIASQVVSKSGSMNMTNEKPPSPPLAMPGQPPVSIMKPSHVGNSSKSSHHSSNSQHAASPNSQKPSVTISLNNNVSSCSMRAGGASKTNVDINNNAVMQTPPSSPPKSALKQTPSKMPLLRPASSSHSMLKTCIETEAPSSVIKKEDEVVSTPPRPKTSRSKHYILQTPVSNHTIVERPKNSPNTYKLVEGTNSKHYLVPVASQHQQPKQVMVAASRSRSRSNTNARSQSQHVLIPAPRMNQSQHLFTQPSPSKSILREPTRPKSRQPPPSISPSGSHSQHVMMESPHYSRYTFDEPPRPKTVRHVFVQPPPTCQNPHLHPRTATILSPQESQQPHMRTCTAPSFAQRYGGYRIIQPCSMHQNHPSQESSRRRHHRREQDYSTAEETASNTSMISSLSTRTENNLSAPSDVEEREHFHARNIPSHHSCHNWHKQESRSSISPSVRVHVKNPTQSPSKTLTSSPSGTKQQYRTTIRIPPGPSKHNFRELEDILSAPSDAESHVEPSRSRPSCHNWQQQNQQSRPPAASHSPSVRVQVRNPASNTVTPSPSSTKQQYRTTIRIPSRHSKLGSSKIEDNLSAPSDTENMPQERVELKEVPSRSRSSCHNWQQENRPHAASTSPSIKVQARNLPRSTSKSTAPSTTSTKEQYRTTLHIPSGPPKPSSYSAIFKEKQQKQKQTVYVDLTSNSNRKNNR